MRPSSTLAKELAEREGFELGEALNGISKLLIRKGAHVPSDPPNSPYLPPKPFRSPSRNAVLLHTPRPRISIARLYLIGYTARQ
jgi:hypothetical protein